MDIALSAEDLEFRDEVRSFLKESAFDGSNYMKWRLDWFKKAADKGG